MSANKSEYLNLWNPRNFIHYLIGIAIESATVGVLMVIAYIISGLGFGLPG
jgi:hypothetical protein